MSKNVSLKTIASRLGVSINTVSHALRDLDDISDEMKYKVRKMAIEMGYMPNHVAQTITLDERTVVGIYFDGFANQYYNILNEELRKIFFNQNEFSLVFICHSRMGIDVIKQCVLQRVDLLLCFSPIDEQTRDFAKLNNIQIVCGGSLCNCADMCDHISVDDDEGCKLVARYLFDPNYDGEYVYVGDEVDAYNRFEHFSKALGMLNKHVKILKFGLAEKDILEICKCIDGGVRKFFCFSDEYAYRLYDKLNSQYIDVDKKFFDLEIVGFDGVYQYVPGLRCIPTVQIDFELFAKELYSMVKNRLKNPDAPLIKKVCPVSLYRAKNAE